MSNIENNYSLSTENVFDERFEKFANSRRAANLANKFKDKTFDDRTRKIAIAALILAAGCTAFSAYSAHFYLLDLFKSFGNIIVAGTATILIIGTIEYAKRESIPEFFKNWFQYKKFDSSNFGIVVFTLACSIGMSFLGSHLIPSAIGSGPELIQIDSIQNHYTELITASQTEADNYFKENNWKNKLDQTSRPTYNKLLAAKMSLETEQKEAIQQAHSENATREKNYQIEKEGEGIQLGFFTIGTEFLLLLCLGFREYRDFRAISQFSNIQNHESSEVHTNIVKSTNSQNDNSNNESRKPEAEPTRVSEKRTTNNNGKRLKGVVQCEHCNEDYVKNHHKQKYCSNSCRAQAYEKRTGKKFYYKSKS